MKQTVLTCILFICCLSIHAQFYIITGKHGSIKASSHQLEITTMPSRTTKVLLPQLYVISATQDPQLAIKSAEEGRFPHMAWKTGNVAETDLFKAFAVTTLKAVGIKKIASNH